MSVSIEDLKPKTFVVEVSVEGTDEKLKIDCKPLRLSHALTISKIGEVFQNTSKATRESVKQAEEDMDAVIGELMPDLKGIELSMTNTMELITQMMEHIQPSDNKELSDKGVKFDSDPKAEKTGL